MSKFYFYDKQIKSYLLQIQRIFSEYYVSSGVKEINGEMIQHTKRVPIISAPTNSIAATFLSGNSENTLIPLPMMSYYITDIQPNTEFRLGQQNDQVRHYTEKAIGDDGKPINKEGNKYTIVQNMPSTFILHFNVDIWASSVDQKLELFEQIVTIFNPGFEFRVNSSEFDLGQKTNIRLENITWSSKSAPIEDDDGLEFMTLGFVVEPVYISSPAKLSVQKNIRSIHTNINSVSGIEDLNKFDFSTVVTVNPKGILEVVKDGQGFIAKFIKDESYKNWEDIFELYGDFDDEVKISITQPPDDASEEVFVIATGTLTDNPTELALVFDIDTMKSNTLPNIDKIVSSLSDEHYEMEEGTVILVASVFYGTGMWMGYEFGAGDVIEKNSTGWTIIFDASENPETIHYITHSSTHIQYRFDGLYWSSTMEGLYEPSNWEFDIRGK